MPDRTDDDKDLRSLVIAESDEARDMLDLAEQLHELLPIESFDQLVERVKDRQLRFRDTDFDVISLAGLLPDVVFPVTDARGLVSRVGELVRSVPAELAVDADSERGQRLSRRARGGFLGSGGRPNAVGAAVVPGGTDAGELPSKDVPDTGRRKA